MKSEDIKPYVGKVVVLDFLNGNMPIMTEITGVGDDDMVSTKEWFLWVPDGTGKGIVPLPYGQHVGFPMAESKKAHRIEAERIGIIMNATDGLAKQYKKMISPIVAANDILDMSNLDLTKLQLNG